jgi:hypothetical protein
MEHRDETGAAADFREAIAVARRVDWQAYELRATMSLGQLPATQGKRDKARAMLAEIYNWFTEGFDTADLKDAKTPLEEFAGLMATGEICAARNPVRKIRRASSSTTNASAV